MWWDNIMMSRVGQPRRNMRDNSMMSRVGQPSTDRNNRRRKIGGKSEENRRKIRKKGEFFLVF
jgi:hypothetical protein